MHGEAISGVFIFYMFTSFFPSHSPPNHRMWLLCQPNVAKPLFMVIILSLIALTSILIVTQQNCFNERMTSQIYVSSRHLKSSSDSNKNGHHTTSNQPLSITVLSSPQTTLQSILKTSPLPNNVNTNDNNSFQVKRHHNHRQETDPKSQNTNLKYEIFLQRPIINPHNFGYIINEPEKCKGSHVNLIITTPSAPDNSLRRMKARQFTPNNSTVGHLFFIGRTLNKDLQAKIEIESDKFRDIIQEDFLDVYVNITHKAMSMLRWVAEFCPDSLYTLRLDDDVTGDLVKMITAMRNAHKKHPDFVIGNVKVGWPVCRIAKCRTTKEEYSGDTLPPFALGGALGYPTKSVIRLYEATKRVRWFKLDDVFVTGMCAPLVNVTLLGHKDFVFKHGAW